MKRVILSTVLSIQWSIAFRPSFHCQTMNSICSFWWSQYILLIYDTIISILGCIVIYIRDQHLIYDAKSKIWIRIAMEW